MIKLPCSNVEGQTFTILLSQFFFVAWYEVDWFNIWVQNYLFFIIFFLHLSNSSFIIFLLLLSFLNIFFRIISIIILINQYLAKPFSLWHRRSNNKHNNGRNYANNYQAHKYKPKYKNTPFVLPVVLQAINEESVWIRWENLYGDKPLLFSSIHYNLYLFDFLIQTIYIMRIAVKNPILQKYIYTIRDPATQRRQFRQNVEKIGEIVAMEIAKNLETKTIHIKTILDKEAQHHILSQDPVLITVLRAGIPFHSGIQRIFSQSETGFFGAKRNQQTLKAELSYIAIPNVKDKVVIVVDTMLATGGTYQEVIKELKKYQPRKVIAAAVIAAEEGIKRIHSYDEKIDVYYACLDQNLNNNGYIVPGLGDAGDRSYGNKI